MKFPNSQDPIRDPKRIAFEVSELPGSSKRSLRGSLPNSHLRGSFPNSHLRGSLLLVMMLKHFDDVEALVAIAASSLSSVAAASLSSVSVTLSFNSTLLFPGGWSSWREDPGGPDR